jgi:hypothetical protein
MPGVRTKEPTQPPITERDSLMQFLELPITAASQSHHILARYAKRKSLRPTRSVERTDGGVHMATLSRLYKVGDGYVCAVHGN